MSTRPRLDRPPVRTAHLSPLTLALFVVVGELVVAFEDIPWTVVGGQMVFLHGVENGRAPSRVTTDIDTAVDVRAAPHSVSATVEALHGLGYASAGTSPEGRAYRFVRGETDIVDIEDLESDDTTDSVDLLVADNLGPRARIDTVGGGKAFETPGVHQALGRTELVPVEVGTDVVLVPRPNLLGAIVAKATAVDVDAQDPGRHISDVMFLSSLIPDPFTMRDALTASDRRRLQRLLDIVPLDDPRWQAEDGARQNMALLTHLDGRASDDDK
jgi:hypothetical protein